MGQFPVMASVLPYLIIPAVISFLALWWARHRGATVLQVRLAFAAAMLGAFMATTGWVFYSYINGIKYSILQITGSQLLAAAACALMVFFGTMPVEQDLTPPDEKHEK